MLGSNDDILARLNALRRSNVSLQHRKVQDSSPLLPSKAGEEEISSDHLFEELDASKMSNKSKSDLTGDAEGSSSLEELLKNLGPEEQWRCAQDEEAEVNRLLNRAHIELRQSTATECSINPQLYHESDHVEDLGTEGDAKSDWLEGINDEAEQYLNWVLDQVKYEQDHERKNPLAIGSGDLTESAKNEAKSAASLTHTTSVLPDVPHALHTHDTPPFQGQASELQARFTALGLPEAPQGEISRSRPEPRSFSEVRDHEGNSWCSICLADATIKCLGCEEELYCAKCWREGHRAKDAGYAERLHRWVDFSRNV